MKITGIIIKVNMSGISIKCHPGRLKEGDEIKIIKGSNRTTKQNSLYWTFLEWCIENGMKDKGHYSVDGLHENIKFYIKDKHKQDFDICKDFTTTDLTFGEFRYFIDIVDIEIMQELGIDTSIFKQEYEERTGRIWGDFNY